MPATIPSETLYPPKTSSRWTAVAGFCFVYIGIRMEPDVGGTGYLVAAFFAVVVLWALARQHPGADYLQIDDSGITICTLFRKAFIPWYKIDTFRETTGWREDHEAVAYLPVSSTAAGDNLEASTDPENKQEKKLPDTYGMPAAALAALLNRRLLESRASGKGKPARSGTGQ